MKRFIAWMALVCTLLVAAPQVPANAHELADNNGISSVLHIPPFDSPEAGKPVTIEFEFGAAVGSFQLQDYAVQAIVRSADEVVATVPVEPAYFGAASRGVARLTFPRIAVYTIELKGTPTAPEHASFAMNYTVRVATGGPKPSAGTDATVVVMIALFIFLLFLMIAVKQIAAGGRYGSRNSAKPKVHKE